MKNTCFVILFLLLTTKVFSCSDSLKIHVIEAIKNDSKIKSLSDMLILEKNDVTCYQGVLLALQAKKCKNWISKFILVNKSLDSLNKAVALNGNLETRFMRYIVCHHLPSLSSWKAHMKEDLEVIKNAIVSNNIPILPVVVQDYILLFFTEKKLLADSELSQLKKNFTKKGA